VRGGNGSWAREQRKGKGKTRDELKNDREGTAIKKSRGLRRRRRSETRRKEKEWKKQ